MKEAILNKEYAFGNYQNMKYYRQTLEWKIGNSTDEGEIDKYEREIKEHCSDDILAE